MSPKELSRFLFAIKELFIGDQKLMNWLKNDKLGKFFYLEMKKFNENLLSILKIIVLSEQEAKLKGMDSISAEPFIATKAEEKFHLIFSAFLFARSSSELFEKLERLFEEPQLSKLLEDSLPLLNLCYSSYMDHYKNNKQKEIQATASETSSVEVVADDEDSKPKLKQLFLTLQLNINFFTKEFLLPQLPELHPSIRKLIEVILSKAIEAAKISDSYNKWINGLEGTYFNDSVSNQQIYLFSAVKQHISIFIKIIERFKNLNFVIKPIKIDGKICDQYIVTINNLFFSTDNYFQYLGQQNIVELSLNKVTFIREPIDLFPLIINFPHLKILRIIEANFIKKLFSFYYNSEPLTYSNIKHLIAEKDVAICFVNPLDAAKIMFDLIEKYDKSNNNAFRLRKLSQLKRVIWEAPMDSFLLYEKKDALIHFSTRLNSPEILKLIVLRMVNYGLSPWQRNLEKSTILEIAYTLGHEEVLKNIFSFVCTLAPGPHLENEKDPLFKYASEQHKSLLKQIQSVETDNNSVELVKAEAEELTTTILLFDK